MHSSCRDKLIDELMQRPTPSRGNVLQSRSSSYHRPIPHASYYPENVLQSRGSFYNITSPEKCFNDRNIVLNQELTKEQLLEKMDTEANTETKIKELEHTIEKLQSRMEKLQSCIEKLKSPHHNLDYDVLQLRKKVNLNNSKEEDISDTFMDNHTIWKSVNKIRKECRHKSKNEQIEEHSDFFNLYPEMFFMARDSTKDLDTFRLTLHWKENIENKRAGKVRRRVCVECHQLGSNDYCLVPPHHAYILYH